MSKETPEVCPIGQSTIFLLNIQPAMMEFKFNGKVMIKDLILSVVLPCFEIQIFRQSLIHFVKDIFQRTPWKINFTNRDTRIVMNELT